MSLGFESAGFDVACAVEIDAVHAAAHKYNFPRTTIIQKSVEDISGTGIRSSSEIGSQKVSVVFGGSPCQGFSLIGKRSLDDPRNSLVRHFMRIVCELDADYFVFENVKGLTVGKHRKFLDEIIECFSSNGYDLISPWKVLNASEYGVPQDRKRLFLVGCKKGLTLPTYPNPTTIPADKNVISNDLPFGPNVFDAIGDIPDADEYEELLAGDAVSVELGPPSHYSSILRGITDDIYDYSYKRSYDSNLLTSSARTNHSKLSRSRFASQKHGTVEAVSRYLKLDPHGVCNTLRAGTDAKRGAFTAARPIHPSYPRCVTVREMARLHSYPDWFRFNWTKWHGAREVGNSVPPFLARAVASAVINALDVSPTKPELVISLGEEHLLKFTPKQAEEFFRIKP